MENPIPFNLILIVAKSIYKHIRPWLGDMAAKSGTPIDDWMLAALDKLLAD